MEGTILSGASAGTVALTIHRLSLQSDSVFTVVLDMLPGEDFRLGAVEDRSVAISFTNRLDLPEWWSMLSKWLGEYNPRKYQKFIELWGGAITRTDINEMKYTILRTFKKVKEYFGDHPEFDVSFPDVDWPV
ncbi:putative lipoprotein [Bacteroides sp. CAG:709]|nr:putative lipoprotein [Bacteroides sp. CAG:709]